MKPREIKAELINKGIKLTDIADKSDSSLSEVSRCISGNGLYLHIRDVIAKVLGKPVNKIFTKDHPKPKRKKQWCRVV